MKCEKCGNEYNSQYYFATPTICKQCYEEMPPEEQKLHQDMMQSMAPVNEYEFRVGFGRRLGAALLDYLFYIILSIALLLVTGMFEELGRIYESLSLTNQEDMQYFSEYIQYNVAPVMMILTAIYFSMEIFLAATPGKMILGIKIASDDRREASLQKLTVRFLIKHADLVFQTLAFIALAGLFGTLQTIAFWVIIIGFFFTLSYRRQAFHDMAAGTAVYFNDELIEENAHVNQPIEP
ncbi:MAG: RDD family protein [Candidatus Kapaibacterium sp.]